MAVKQVASSLWSFEKAALAADDPARMGRNLDPIGDLVISEAVMMGLEPAPGRQRTHDLVYEVCRAVARRARNLLGRVRPRQWRWPSCRGRSRRRPRGCKGGFYAEVILPTGFVREPVPHGGCADDVAEDGGIDDGGAHGGSGCRGRGRMAPGRERTRCGYSSTSRDLPVVAGPNTPTIRLTAIQQPAI